MRNALRLAAVAAFALAVLGLGAWVAAQFAGRRVDRTRTWRASFEESVEGLVPGVAVTYMGVRKGRVLDYELDGPTRVLVEFEVDAEVKLDRDHVVASLETKFPSGQKWIELRYVPKLPAEPALRWEREIRTQKSASVPNIIERVVQLTDSLDKTLADVRGTISEMNSTMKEFREFLTGKQVQDALTELTATTRKFGSLLERIDGIVASEQGDVERTIREAAAGAASIRKASERLAGLLDRADSAIDDVQGVGREGRARLRETLDSVNRSVRLIEETISEIRENPHLLLQDRAYAPREIPDP